MSVGEPIWPRGDPGDEPPEPRNPFQRTIRGPWAWTPTALPP
jgi:hypothetical protein